jgi:formylglycine-generating enzyme required for sulfatase activity
LEIGRATKIRVVSNLEAIGLQRLTKPDWAVEFGRDAYGVYGDFEVDAQQSGNVVRQRLRWIRPGSFDMGSPTDEAGRYEDESLHAVTISSGFWMFDTVCSQRLWTAIMIENPSHFPDPDRPVESVDWGQANEFAKRLSQRLSGRQDDPLTNLKFELPTEAQWEYACRAGTSTAIYTGPLDILGDANAPTLDAIAWYGGNSGYQYDLDQSVDVSGYDWLSEKQFPFTHAGTRRIKQKAPNPWGLYDMLGNVWEWCMEWYTENLEGSSVDPHGPESGSYRVIRGGSWFYDARCVRSACRVRYDPGLRYEFLGFRLLSSASSAKSSPVERVSGSRRIPRDEAGENQRTK